MRIFLSVVGVVILGAGLLAGYLDQFGVMMTTFFAFLACLIAANLDRISEFKATAGGVEARTREVLVRAEHTLRELQLLARRNAELMFSLVQRTGRWGTYTDEEQETIKNDVLSVLRELKVPEAEVQASLKDWHKVVEFDYSHFILGTGNPDTENKETRELWDSLRQGGISRYPSPEELERFLLSHDFMSPERQELIADYVYYRQHRSHRRPEVWKNRLSWGILRSGA